MCVPPGSEDGFPKEKKGLGRGRYSKQPKEPVHADCGAGQGSGNGGWEEKMIS